MKHVKTTRRWPYLALAAVLSLGTIGLSSQVEAASANPTPVCSNGLCTVTFDYTGDVYVYAPPVGIRTLSFELAGAQGGRSGGLGGKVTGTFSTIPASMNIYVGGAGKQGASATGGYNGGGSAGGSHGDEGSGGGASDIRLTAAVDDRIVVAGGGGGTGGWIGQAGAAGGGLIAVSGSGTSPSGGGGANQTQGGTAGMGSAAGSGTAGAKGTGGNGGVGSVGGGGGGGGGYFGGGGGGADGIASGTDGAGGGGGSSFATANYTKSVVHTPGVRAGNGQVILSYTFAPTVTTFAPVSSSANQTQVQYNLTFSQTVGGLEAADISVSGTAGGCQVGSVTGSGASYSVTISGCSDGTLLLTLAADSVTGAMVGPASAYTTTSLSLDRKNPSFTITAPATPNKQTTLAFAVAADEAVTGLSASSFTTTGTNCQVGAVTGSGQAFTVNVIGCDSATTAVLTLKANSANDIAGNAGPLTALVSTSVLTDFDVPTPTAFGKSADTHPGLIGYDLTFSEPVTGLASSSFDVHGEGCVISKLSGSGASYTLWLTDCLQGVSASLTLKALSVTDAAANAGPIVGIDSVSVSIDDQTPTAQVVLLARATQTSQPAFDITFSEAVQGFGLNVISHSGSATGCNFALATTLPGLKYRVTASGCSSGSVRLELPARIVADATGNLGPATLVSSEQVVIDKTPTNPAAGNASIKPVALKPRVSPQAVAPKPVVETMPVVASLPRVVVAKPVANAPTVVAKPEANPAGIGAVAGSVLLAGAWIAWRRRGF